jgi:zinc protease
MNETLEFLGASVETGMEPEEGSASFECLSRDLDTVLPMFADVLREPAFREDKFQVAKQQLLEDLRRRNDEPRNIARREARRALFGPDHPYGRRYEPATVEKIVREDLVSFHKRFFKPRAVTLALSGDFEVKEMLAKLEGTFGDWEDAAPEPLPAVPAGKAPGRKVVLIAKDNITQTTFRVVEYGLKRHDPDHFAFEVANDVLGGNSFVSRLFTDIRSRQGLAYSVGSFFSEWKEGGMFGAACGTRNENAIKALRAILGEILDLRERPVSASELEVAKNSTINSFIFHYQTPLQIIAERAELEYFGYPGDYLDTYLDHVHAVDSAAALAASKKWLHPDEALILLVGPSSLKKDLEAFGTVEVRQPD